LQSIPRQFNVNNTIMKKNIFILFTLLIVVAGCKKSSNSSGSASFTTTGTNYYINQTVTFSNTSSGSSSYSWDFGDGQTSTQKTPVHAYSGPGVYAVKLTVGSSTAIKAVKIYGGTASYEVDNNTKSTVPMVSFSADASGNIIDFMNHGVLAPGGKSDTVFTTDKVIYIGGNLPTDDSVFIAVYPTTLVQFTHNKLALTDTTSIFTNGSIQKRDINQLFHSKNNALKSPLIQRIKHTAQ
jgi:PKD repeat protein